MGGQACVFYGAAEFSRNLDLIQILDEVNLQKLQLALEELKAERIAVPPFTFDFLRRGHAVHFRCNLPGVEGLRIDIMSKLRGVDDFESLWLRRTTVEIDTESVEMLSLPDLVLAKKTQRDKDWPMIRRLMEQAYYEAPSPTPKQIEFLLAELRSPDLLLALTRAHPEEAKRSNRIAVRAALSNAPGAIEAALAEEQQAEIGVDKHYWEPLKKELEFLRQSHRQNRET